MKATTFKNQRINKFFQLCFRYSKFINQDENKRVSIAYNQKQGQRTTLA